MKADRREKPRETVDRRRSERWETNKLLHWRVYRGRRLRESHIVERSLNGVVLQVEPHDVARQGTRLLLSDPTEIDKLGFRSARVTRAEGPSAEMRLVYAEIEA
jgi:hypothetical protein